VSRRNGAGLMRPLLQHLRVRQSTTVNRRIFAAMVVVGGVTVITKTAAMAKDMVTASSFGTSDAMDAFLIAFVLPSIAINIIAGSLEVAIVPVYVQVRERDGAEAANDLLASILVSAALLLSLTAVVVVAAGPHLLHLFGSTFDGEKLLLTRRLFFLLMPLVVVGGCGMVLSAVLTANERFLLTAAMPLVSIALTIVLLVAGGKQLGVYALALGVLVGRVLEVLFLAWRMRRAGLLAWARSRRWHPALRQVLGNFGPIAVGAAVISNSLVVDQTMAAMLGSGNVAALNYGNKLVAAGLGAVAPVVVTVIFPHFARMVATGDWPGLRHTFRTYSWLIVALTVPVSLLIGIFSTDLVRLLFERGQFTAADTAIVARVQSLYALQIPFYVLSMVGVRLLSAMQSNRAVMIIFMASFVVNVIGNLVFMRWWGLPGIALSTSVVYLLSMLLVLIAIGRRIAELEGRPMPRVLALGVRS